MATPVKYLILEENPIHRELKIKQYFHDQTTYEYFKYRTLPFYGPGLLGLIAGNSIGGPPTAIIGGGIGLIGGAYITRQITEYNFKEWKNLNTESKVFQEFHDCHPQFNELIELRCPITKELISDPVKTPFGDYYERKSLEDLAAMHPKGEINDPQGKGRYSIKDLLDAPEYTIKMKNIFKCLLQKERISTSLSPSVAQAMGLLVADLSRQVTNYVYRQTNLLLEQLHTNQITLQQYNDRVSYITKITSDV